MAPRFPSFPSDYGKIRNADDTPSKEWVTFVRDLEAYLRAPSLESRTVAQLPPAAANTGVRYLVTNATVTTFASTVAGGGANIVPVVSNGTNWVIG